MRGTQESNGNFIIKKYASRVILRSPHPGKIAIIITGNVPDGRKKLRPA